MRRCLRQDGLKSSKAAMYKRCKTCKLSKPLTEFRCAKKGGLGTEARCKNCMKQEGQQRYANNKIKVIAQVTTRRQRLLAQIRAYKIQHPCKCGESELCCLVFHHRNSEEKDFTISDLRTGTFEQALVEIEKCDVLCRNCHSLEHENNKSISTNEVKYKLDAFKAEHPCKFCHEARVICLSFHHLDPTTKLFNVSEGNNRAWTAIERERDKCIVVCHNCHAKIHAGLLTIA